MPVKQDKAYSSEAGLYDSFEHRGKWWLPDTPDDRVHGTVAYSPAQRITLRLDGKFQRPELQNILFSRPFKTECILGQTAEEEFVTLQRVFASRVARTDTFTANTLVTGGRFSSASDLLISGALIGYTNLDEWAAVRMLQMEKGVTPDRYHVIVPTSATDLFAVRDRALFQELTLFTAVGASWERASFSAQMEAFFDCNFEHPIGLRQTQSIVVQLGNLLSILQGETACATHVRLKIPAPDNPHRIANVFWVPRTVEPPIVSNGEMNLSFRELANHSDHLFGSWFTNETLFNPVYDLLVGTYGRQSERTKFRALAQALESFHRGAYGGVYVSVDEYEPIRETLCSAIPPGIDKDFQDRLKAAVKYGYQYSLRTRLKLLLQKLRDQTKEALLGEKPQTFIDLTVRVRNYLTHFDEAEKPAVVDDTTHMYNLNQRLRALLIVLLLTYLGVPEEKIANGVVSHLNLAR